MSLLDRVVESALNSRDELAVLRPVVEKEILHHDILRIMSRAGYLSALVFMGGTCLRDCHGSPRLSEDLDFAGGRTFDHNVLRDLGQTVAHDLRTKYGLPVEVRDPVREEGDTVTWKVRMTTRPEQPHLPAQRIHIDVCALASHDPRPATIRNHYGVEMGTAGLILRAESRSEIFADKLIALALRRSRVKHRDVWDLMWLLRQGVAMDVELVRAKLADRGVTVSGFIVALQDRVHGLAGAYADYQFELQRFLPSTEATMITTEPLYWDYVTNVLSDLADRCASGLAP